MIRRRAASHKRMSRRWASDHARRHESSRVRPDHVSCCIVHPSPGNRRSVTSVACPRAIENAGGEKDEGISGRGSCVRFTSCVASRSWLFEYVRSRNPPQGGTGVCNLHSSAYVARSATGVSEVASNRRTSTRRKRSIETGRHHRSAQRRREAPSAPVLLERARKPSGSGCPFDSRDGQKSVVRIFGSSIRGVARHHGPPAGLATEALT